MLIADIHTSSKLLKFVLFTIVNICLQSPIVMHAQEGKKNIKDGNEQYASKEYSKAETNYSEAINKNKNSIISQFNLGNAYYQQKKYKEAAEQFEKITNETTSKDTLAKAFHNLGNAYMKTSKFEEAVKAYKNSLRNDPNDKDTRYNLAYAQQKLIEQQEQQKEGKKDDENKEEDKDKDKKEDQKKDEDKENDKEEDKKEDDSKKDKNEKKKEQPKKDEISKEDAKRLLDALQNDEKELQEKLQKQKAKGAKVKIEKDW